MPFFLALLITALPMGTKNIYAGYMPDPESAKYSLISCVGSCQRSDHNLNASDGYKAKSTEELKQLKKEGKEITLKTGNAHNL